jgi:hypothetical protein
MMRHMPKKLLSITILLLLVAFTPLSARADDQSNAPKEYDGRLDNYGKNVTLDNSGAALTYFVWAGLGVLAVIGLFKDAKRSHLD